MPAIKTGGLAADEQLVKVSEMEEWAQLAFEGYKCALLRSQPSQLVVTSMHSLCTRRHRHRCLANLI